MHAGRIPRAKEKERASVMAVRDRVIRRWNNENALGEELVGGELIGGFEEGDFRVVSDRDALPVRFLVCILNGDAEYRDKNSIQVAKVLCAYDRTVGIWK